MSLEREGFAAVAEISKGNFKTETAAQLSEDLSFMRSAYGIVIDMGPLSETDTRTLVEIKCLPPQEHAHVVRAVREELAKYPQDYLAHCNIKRLRIVNKLVSRHFLYPEEKQAIGGLASYDMGLAYISTVNGYLPKMRASLHHELFHMSDSDYIQKGKKQSTVKKILNIRGIFYNARWRALNTSQTPPYIGETYWSLPLSRQWALSHAGYASPFGRLNCEEDRATIAEEIMTDLPRLLWKTQFDTVLGEKVDYVDAIFKARSNGKMDISYFRDLLHGRVKEGYWESQNPKT